jgi:hypothetical protein
VDINSLPDDPATLKGLLAEMATSQADQQQQIAQLEQRIRLLNLVIYGSKSEKKPRTGQEQQLSLFDEAEQTAESGRRGPHGPRPPTPPGVRFRTTAVHVTHCNLRSWSSSDTSP